MEYILTSVESRDQAFSASVALARMSPREEDRLFPSRAAKGLSLGQQVTLDRERMAKPAAGERQRRHSAGTHFDRALDRIHGELNVVLEQPAIAGLG